jgi:hypothetical protein
MKTINLLTTAFLIALTSTAFAQKMKLTDGSFKDMSGQSSVLVVYKYDDMNVGTGKRQMKEPAYVERKKGEYNEKEAGRGDNWEKSWKGDRESRFHGKFEALFNKGMKKEGIVIDRDYNDAKYTLIVHTTMTEPGFSVPMIMTVPASINLKLQLVETGSDQVLGEATATGAPGNAFAGAAWDTGNRIQESYAKAGKTFAKWLPKKGMK